METEEERDHHRRQAQRVKGRLSLNNPKLPAVPAVRNNKPGENNPFTGPTRPSDKPSRYNEGGAALFDPAPAITTWGAKYKQKLDAQTMKDNLKLEKVGDQRRREAQEKLATIRRHSPEALSSSVTRNNKELAEEWNQIRQAAQKELQEKRIQRDKETERFFQAQREGKMSDPNKGKAGYVRAQRKGTRVGKGVGKALSGAVTQSTTIPVPSTGSKVFMFGATRKPAGNDQAVGGKPSPFCRTENNNIKGYRSSKGGNEIATPKKRKTSKKLKRHREHMKWISEQKNLKSIRTKKPKRTRRTRERLNNKNVPSENKKRSNRTGRKRRRARYIEPKKGKKEKKEGREGENGPTPRRIKRRKTSLAVRQAPSPAGRYARLRSNKRYKPGD